MIKMKFYFDDKRLLQEAIADKLDNLLDTYEFKDINEYEYQKNKILKYREILKMQGYSPAIEYYEAQYFSWRSSARII